VWGTCDAVGVGCLDDFSLEGAFVEGIGAGVVGVDRTGIGGDVADGVVEVGVDAAVGVDAGVGLGALMSSLGLAAESGSISPSSVGGKSIDLYWEIPLLALMALRALFT